jgi:HEAT repeat protein
MRVFRPLFVLTALALVFQARAYVDLAPTLAKIISDSQSIQLVEVAQFDLPKHSLSLKPVRAFKGTLSKALVQHDVAAPGGTLVPPTIQQWAEAGARGVLFSSRTTQLLCLGEGWYAVRSTTNAAWRLGPDRTELPLAYYGSVSRLADAIARMLAGRDAIITTVQHGVDDAASFDVALNRAGMPGLIRVQRIRANMGMPARVMGVSANPAYLIGKGRVGEEDLPALLAQLRAGDAAVRAEAAEELGELGRKAAPAEKPLTDLLRDKSARVRLFSASALLCINGSNAQAAAVLATGLTDRDATVRCDAAQATGRCGAGAAPLLDKLGLLLKDQSEATRVSALQAIQLLGPLAASAAPAVVPLLDNTNTCIEAADALGRIGPRARPVPKRLVEMLKSGDSAMQWAALRAMAQIGGKEAHPAVDFIVVKLPTTTEIEGYNMMIYLALLGPDAADAIAVTELRVIRHPVIPTATRWAMTTNCYPWEMPGAIRTAAAANNRQGRDYATPMYEAYIRELGERLRPLALKFAQELKDGKARNIPVWGYKLLNCAPEESVSKLTPCLSDTNMIVRERAAVALGYMGDAAYTAKDHVAHAVRQAPAPPERLLLEWCLREITQ